MSTRRYLRLSLTDRCNLRCRYCMPHGYRVSPKSTVLTLEERVTLSRLLAREFGIEKIRLTGGEPLLYRGLEPLLERLAAIPEVTDLALTTNAIGLAKRARRLRSLGLQRVNISLDTLDRQRFASLCQRDELPAVVAGIDAAREAGLAPVKINAVVIRGLTDDVDELRRFLDFAADRDVEVRFLELMPIGGIHHLGPDASLPCGAITDLITRHFGDLVPQGRSFGGTAEEFTLAHRGQTVRVGMITPVSKPFCVGCGRYRLTSKGRLVTCLRSQRGTDLRDLLRRSGDLDAIADHIRQHLAAPRHDGQFQGDMAMTAIGG